MDTVTIAAPGALNLSFPTETGWNYILEYTESLAAPVWLPLTNSAGTGSSISFVESTPPSSNRFYRVRMSK